LIQYLPVRRSYARTHLVEVFAEIVEDALQALLVLGPAVELLEHLVRVVDGRHRLVWPGIGHAGPGIGPFRHHYTEFQRAKAGSGGRVLLEEALDLLIDGDSARPAGRGVGAALNVAGKELDAREQAADSPHVVVAVAPHAVAYAIQNQRLVLERLKRLEALFERKVLPFL